MIRRKNFNLDVLHEINKAHHRGASKEELKKLYIKHNCFEVAEDCPVYRIFELPNQLADIKDSKFTLVNPVIFKDRYENPLLDMEFTDETGQTLTLNGVVRHYYVSSWTYDEEENPYSWVFYTRGNMGIRLKSTVGKVMEEMLNLANPYCELSFHAGTVDYYEREEIDAWLSNSHYTDFLDSLGQLSVTSLMALRNDHTDEKEVRFVFSHRPNTDNHFIDSNVTIGDELCKHPINWQSVIDEIVLDPRISDEQFEETEQQLRKYGFACEIKHSTCR